VTVSAITYTVTVGDQTLTLTDGQAILDESWTPYGQANLAVALPVDLDALDPREDARIRVHASQRFGTSFTLADITAGEGTSTAEWTAGFPGGGPLSVWTARYSTPYNDTAMPSRVRRFNLGVRSRRVDAAAGTVSITAATDEARLMDLVNVTQGQLFPAAASAFSVALLVLTQLGTSARMEPGTSDVAFPSTESLPWEPGTSAWDYVRTLMDVAGRRLWCDETGAWWIGRPNITTGPAVDVDESTAVAIVDDVSRDTDWYDGVSITWRWTSYDGTENVQYETAGGLTPSRVLALTYDRRYTGDGAAASILARSQRRGRTLEVETTADPARSPRAPLTVALGDDVHDGFVVRTEWNFNSDRMRYRSRDILE
jgi:hypothetical protein